MDPSPATTQRGTPVPLWNPPLYCRKSGKKRPRRGRSEANQRSVCRGRRRRSGASEACRLRRDEGCGACADARPPLCRRGGGIHKGGTPSKGSLPCAVFWSLLSAQKVTRGMGPGRPHTPGVRGRSPRKLSNRMAVTGEETCFSPTRPAMGESMRIGALRWHRAI